MSSLAPEQAALEEFLRNIPLFAELNHADMAGLIGASRRLSVRPGTQIIAEGAAGDTLIVILSGRLEVSKSEDGHEITLAVRGAGDFLGEMSLLEQRPRTASVRAVEDAEILEIDAGAFQQLLHASPAMAMTILRTVAARLRSTESSLMQREKLASLGTLAAGLAHELNNPSAAIQRSSAQLAEVLDSLDRRAIELSKASLSADEQRLLTDLSGGPSREKPALSPREAMAEEDRLVEALEALGVETAWDIAPGFAAMGWTRTGLDALLLPFDPSHRRIVAEWVGNGFSARQLGREVERSARAISDIVRAVKSYSYLDQAGAQSVDLMMSLEDTLMILKHKLREGITVSRDYAPDLPRIEAYGSELNQVWTNLVDNAIDAMDGKGDLEIHVGRLGEEVEIRIANSGPQIPPEVAGRLFEPFFTTKPQGIGTGLGLHVSHNIVVNHHGGTIAFTSVPGRTEFRVRLPIQRKR